MIIFFCYYLLINYSSSGIVLIVYNSCAKLKTRSKLMHIINCTLATEYWRKIYNNSKIYSLAYQLYHKNNEKNLTNRQLRPFSTFATSQIRVLLTAKLTYKNQNHRSNEKQFCVFPYASSHVVSTVVQIYLAVIPKQKYLIIDEIWHFPFYFTNQSFTISLLWRSSQENDHTKIVMRINYSNFPMTAVCQFRNKLDDDTIRNKLLFMSLLGHVF